MTIRTKPKIAILRGSLMSPYEMQSLEPLKGRFDFNLFTPHKTHHDLAALEWPRESLWCPLQEKIPMQNPIRNALAAGERVTGHSRSYCGLADRLKGFDILHVMDQYYCYCWEAVAAKRKWGGRLVVTQWENIPHLNESRYFQRRTKRLVREWGDLFVAMSAGARRVLEAEGVAPSRVREARGAVDTRHFKPGAPQRALADALGIPRGSWVVMYAGRLHEDKGIFTLLEAFERLSAAQKDWRLLLVGRDESGIARWVSGKGLGGRIRLAGFVPYERMADHYRLAKAFVLPSIPLRGWSEQFGYVLAEAMACGIPVLGSDCGAIPEGVGDRDRLFPPGDSQALADRLLALRRKPWAPLNRAARRRALELYSSERLARDLARFYGEALTLPPASAR